MSKYMYLFIALMLNSFANFLLKKGAVDSGKSASRNGQGALWALITRFLDLETILAIILFGLNIFFYKQALARLPVSVAYPVTSALGFVVVLLLGFIFLRERLNILQIIGLVVIVVGVALMTSTQS